MNLNQAAVFVRVVEAGSFTAAAARLGMPKSTVSRRVSQLEERLGVRLLQRTTRKLHLTDEGNAYYREASRALSGLEEAERTVLRSLDAPRGTLRVTAPVDIGPLVGALLARFCARYPEIHVCLDCTQRKVDLVGEGYDLALRGGTLQDSSMVARRLRVTELGLYASQDYLTRHGPPQRLSDLAGHTCLVFGDSLRDVWHMQGPHGEERVAVEGRIASNDFGVLWRAAAEGAGIARVPRRNHGDPRMVRVLPEYSLSSGGLYAVYPSSQHLVPKVRVFVDFLAEALADDLAGG